MKLRGKRILVTGSTGGIGTLVCQLLAEQGVELVLTCFNADALAGLQSALPGQHRFVVADISKSTDRQVLVSKCTDLGGIDGLINIAGILDFALFENQDELTITRIMTVNLPSVMLLCHDLIPQLKARDESIIVNVGSIFGSIGHPGFVAYCASKAGIKSFSEALSRELADTPVRVSYIAPRATRTALNNDRVNQLNTELGNKSDPPLLVARAIVQQAESGKSVSFLGWPEKLFVRINALFPALVHKSLVNQLGIIKKYAKAEEVKV